MSLIQSTAIPSGATAYELEQSLRFEDGRTPYLSKTFASAGNRKTWSFSVWFKRGNTGGTNNAANKDVFLGGINDGNMVRIADDRLQWYVWDGSADYGWISTAFVRDTSAWYHALFVFNTTSGTATHRQRIYLNGVELTDKATDYGNPPLNYDGLINTAGLHTIGKGIVNEEFDGYLAEVNFVDGQALTPSDFGETGTYGEWKPIEYSGSYGTNGFYLPFKQDYIVEGFSTVTYRGTGATQYIGGTGFSPDLVWVKRRDSSAWHILSDSVRGTGKSLYSNDSAVEGDDGSVTLAAFNTDGFTIGSSGAMNTSGASMVGWNWDMGGSNASNTNGSITSTVRANPTYGQSIVSYTGNGTASATVGHGLSAKPEMIIIKNRTSASKSWYVYHEGLHASSPEDYRVELNATNAASLNTTGNSLQGTAPTSSLFTLGNGSWVNENNSAIIAYCFHSVTGYSKFGTYTGNGSASGPTVTTGFRPAFLMTKQSSTTGDWTLHDSTRDANTILYKELTANSAGAEGTSDADLEFTDTGFVIKRASGQFNTDGATIIYMAFADTREYAYWLDQSGNNNDWTSNNLTESDVMVDSPTNNFCTMNPLSSNALPVISEGNLKNAGTNNKACTGTIGTSSGKWYWEVNINNDSLTSAYLGITKYTQENDPDVSPTLASSVGRSIYRAKSDSMYKNYTNTSYTSGDGSRNPYGVMGFALDLDGGSVKYYQDGSLVHTDSTVPTDGTDIFPYFGNTYAGGSGYNSSVANFGQDSSFAGNKTAQGNQDGNGIGDFYYAPPTGFLALCTSNLPDVAVVPSENFNPVIYTGDGNTTNAITGVGFQPDFTWIKHRTAAYNHALFDAVRGATKEMASNTTSAEATETTSLKSFNADGFTLGDKGGVNNSTGSANNFISWNWKANGSGSSNTNGDITSTVSANVDAGFSIVSYTGNGSNATVGHGLSKAPEMIHIKNRADADSWLSFYTVVDGSLDYMYINLTNARTNAEGISVPTASVFSLDSGNSSNGSSDAIIAYCFHSVDGYSKVGSYTGNGNADGTFVYTGFRPAWVMWKKTNAAGTMWQIMDTTRDPFNVMDLYLQANSSNAEGDYDFVDYTSNGFKHRHTSGHANGSGDTYIYLAFAESPFKYSNAR